MVAAGVAEIDFAVVDDRVAPIRHVERAVGAELHVDGAEAEVGGADEVGHFLGGVAGGGRNAQRPTLNAQRRRVGGRRRGFLFIGRWALGVGRWTFCPVRTRGHAQIGDAKAHNPVRAEVAGDGVALPFGGKGGAVDELQAGEFRIRAGAHARHGLPRSFVGREHRAGEGPVDAAAAGTVGEEALPPAIPGVAPGVDPPFGKDLGALGARVVGEAAAGVQPHHAPRGLEVAVDVDALVKIKPSIRPPAQGVEDVVGVLRAEAGEDDALFAVGGEVEEFGALADVAAVGGGRGNAQRPTPNAQRRSVGGRSRGLFFLRSWALGVGRWTFSQIRHDACRDQQPSHENLALRRSPRPPLVGEDEDFVIRRLSRLDHRVKRRAADPEAAEGVPIHLRGFFQQRIFRPQLDLVAVGDGEGGSRRRGGRNVQRRTPNAQRRSVGGRWRNFFFLGRWALGVGRWTFNSGALFQALDLGFGLFDEGVEHGHLFGVLPLLVLAKAGEVGAIGRPPAVEEEFVLGDDGSAEGRDGGLLSFGM